MKAGIIVDGWKVEIFKQHLDKAKRQYTVQASDVFTLIKVECETEAELMPIVVAAQNECARMKMN